jgi:FkbM family methyltransferase
VPDYPYVERAKVWGNEFYFNICNSQAETWYGVGDELEKWNDFDPPMQKLISRGDTVIDCGANQGWTSLSYAKRVGSEGTVCSVEGDSNNCKRIHTNLELNSEVKNMGVFNNVIGSKSGENIPFARNECVKCEWSPHVMQKVKSICIDDFIDMGHKVDVIKIDVEGYELEALKGATKTLAKLRPRLEVEIHTFQPNGPDIRNYGGDIYELYELLTDQDYNVYSAGTVPDEGISVLTSGIYLITEPTYGAMKNMIWALPKGDTSFEEEFDG